MTGRLVVPTLAGAPPQNQSLGGFRVASCESRASMSRVVRLLIEDCFLLFVVSPTPQLVIFLFKLIYLIADRLFL